MDLFGLGRQADESTEPADDPAEPEAPVPRGSHRLWAFLLVLDSIFVIVFGGTVAAKIYQHWKTPAAPAAPAVVHRRATAKPAVEAPKPAEPAASTAAVPAKPAEPPKTADAPRPPKPSLLTEPPKPRETPKPAAAGAAPARPSAPAAPEAKAKAMPVVFRLRAPAAKSAQLVGAFIVRGGRKDMTKDDDGSWTVKLYLHPGQYRYFFSVDRKKTLDPENPRSDRGASLLTVP